MKKYHVHTVYYKKGSTVDYLNIFQAIWRLLTASPKNKVSITCHMNRKCR